MFNIYRHFQWVIIMLFFIACPSFNANNQALARSESMYGNTGISSEYDTIKTTTSHTYDPSFLIVYTGDVVTIMASTFHPLVQVSKETWDSSSSTPLPGGWGVQTAPYTFTAGNPDTIYFVCQAHVSLGMKGMLVILGTSDVPVISFESFDFTVYPNPVSSVGNLQIHLNMPGNVSIKIYDVNGKIIRTLFSGFDISEGDFISSFDVSGLDDGSYFIAVSDKQKQFVKKLTVLK